MRDYVIVTRHKGAVEWLASLGIKGPVLDHATRKDVAGKIVIGNIPLHLAEVAKEVWAISLPDLPKHLRGRDISADEMNQYGAYIRRYRVTRISEEELP
jgi:putative CRISPR-associated protein (TIGR02620 family)